MGAMSKPIFSQPRIDNGEPKSSAHALQRVTIVAHSWGGKKFHRRGLARSTSGVGECFEPNFGRFFPPKLIVRRIEPKAGNQRCFGRVAEDFAESVRSTGAARRSIWVAACAPSKIDAALHPGPVLAAGRNRCQTSHRLPHQQEVMVIGPVLGEQPRMDGFDGMACCVGCLAEISPA